MCIPLHLHVVPSPGDAVEPEAAPRTGLVSMLLSTFSQRQQKPAGSQRPFLLSQPRAQDNAAERTRFSTPVVRTHELNIESVALAAAAEQFQCNPSTWALLRFAFSSVTGGVNGQDLITRLQQRSVKHAVARAANSALALNPFTNTVRHCAAVIASPTTLRFRVTYFSHHRFCS